MLRKGEKDPGNTGFLRMQLILKRQRSRIAGKFGEAQMLWGKSIRTDAHPLPLPVTVTTKYKHFEEIQITVTTNLIL